MLFNSYTFLFGFLPIVFFGFFVASRANRMVAALWLTLASLVFYGWWNIAFVPLLLASILFNYGMGYAIARTRRKPLLVLAIAINLAVLGYYKYAGFFAANILAITGADLALAEIILPIGISFFTFTQIAFLVDAWAGIANEYRLIHYCLFVSYFPHLVAGPVLHHKQMMPQFGESSTYCWNWDNIALGLTLFAIGLFKKTVLADGVAVYAIPVFSAAQDGAPVFFFEAWVGALAYTLQLYFDFSGYSDMAIGLSRIFNVKLPLNFHSPYKAANIIEFWRRWHMTLSRFLRDYLYIPLGGNRYGPVRRYANLLLTMLLGGLWHGAGWTFIIWGGLHGLYLIINHGWQALIARLSRVAVGANLFAIGGSGAKAAPLCEQVRSSIGRIAGQLLTFLAVVFAWVFFRAADLNSAIYLVKSMLGLHGFSLPESLAGTTIAEYLSNYDVMFRGVLTNIQGGAPDACLWIVILLGIVWLLPNTQQMTADYHPASDCVETAKSFLTLRWKPNLAWSALTAGFLALGVLELSKVSEFLYFQF